MWQIGLERSDLPAMIADVLFPEIALELGVDIHLRFVLLDHIDRYLSIYSLQLCASCPGGFRSIVLLLLRLVLEFGIRQRQICSDQYGQIQR
jgi:hypothetical protein